MDVVRKPIQKQELEAFRRSLKPGDKIVYIEEAPRDDGIKGSRRIKRVMEVEKVHRFTVDLAAGRIKRNITLQEALINSGSRSDTIKKRIQSVIELAEKGMDNAEIAQKTGYSRRSVANIRRADRERKEGKRKC